MSEKVTGGSNGKEEEETTEKDRNGANWQLKNWSEARTPRPVVRRGFRSWRRTME